MKLSINHKGSKARSDITPRLTLEQEDHVFEFASADAVQERDGFKQFLAKVHSPDAPRFTRSIAVAEAKDRRR